TIPGAVVILLAKQYVKAVFNTRSDFTCGSGSGVCECIIAQLAGTIVHETCHSCLLGEIPANLLTAHYQATFTLEQGNNSSHCCGTLPFSYDESDWDKASAAATSEVTRPEKGGDERWRLTSC
ncbi:MAG TPA: hypothetical protein PLA94_07800, partial [Myxococcota bacterium]|nr:hypothetical protein [Myxococcota bacterium]